MVVEVVSVAVAEEETEIEVIIEAVEAVAAIEAAEEIEVRNSVEQFVITLSNFL